MSERKKYTIEKSELMKLLHIGSESTIKSYVREGMFPKPIRDPYGNTLFDRQQIFKILGFEQEPDEPLITYEEAAPIIGATPIMFREYCKRHKIPYYVFKNSRGSKTYFLRSEIEKAKQYKAKWGTEFPDFVAKNHSLRLIMEHIINTETISGLNKGEEEVLRKIILGSGRKRPIDDVAEEMGLTRERVRQLFMIGLKRIHFGVMQWKNKLEMVYKMQKENKELKIQNGVLLEKLAEENRAIIEEEVKYLATEIDNMTIPVRVRHLFDNIEAKTLNDVVKFRRSDLFRYRNVGAKTLVMVETILKEKGLWWKEEENPKTKEQLEGNIEKIEVPAISIPLHQLSTKVRRLLLLMGVKHLGELSQLKRHEALKHSGYGKSTLAQLEILMETYGVKWKI